MSMFECMTESDGEIVFSIKVGVAVRRLARQALLGCDRDEALTWKQVGELTRFSIDELSRGARFGIECADKIRTIDELQGPVASKRFESEAAYLIEHGEDIVLDDWLSQNEGPDWQRLREISPSLSSEHAMAALSLWQIDKAVIAMEKGESQRACELMAVASGALSSAFFFTGWFEGMRTSDEKRREDGQRGAEKTNAPKSKLKKWVVDTFHAGSWPSAYRASFILAPLAIAKAPEFQTVLSGQRAQTTIYEWLRAAGPRRSD